jgi:hypothetical protein
MPLFNTVAQAQQWCAQHFPAEPTQGTHMFSYVKAVTLGDVGIFAAGWVLGRWGWDVVWSWLKAAWTKVSGATSTVVTEVKTVV